LKCKRREMYKLYVYAGENRTSVVRERDRHMRCLAQEVGVEVVEEKDIGMLDSMSNSRPHNVPRPSSLDSLSSSGSGGFSC
jgi:21S rRNA (GM2251-2'-O)-methyltransferase